ncbi:MAG: universal stress protein [Chloroflexi bacterium]|nr:universal stress protein [Chloroflexota bacterium]
MAKKVLVPADGSTAAREVMRNVVRELGADAEVILGFVQTPEMSHDDRINATTHLIDQVGRARSDDINCKLVRNKHDTVPEGIVALAKQEHVDMIAMYTDPNRPASERPEGPFAQKVKQMAPCEVRIFDISQIPASA